MTDPPGHRRPSAGEFLSGVRVLELGDGLSGAAATSLLAALGAEVTAVVVADSHHRRSRPVTRVGGEQVSLLAAVLDRGKQLVPGATLAHGTVDALVGPQATAGRPPFDLVVVDRVVGLGRPMAALDDLDRYLAFVDRCNTTAWVTISAFGLTGRRRHDVATELSLAAAAGMLATVRDPVTDHPLKLAGHQSLLNAAQAAALAACHALDLRRDGAPVHLDLSAAEATIAIGPLLEVSSVLLDAGGAGGAKRYGAPASFYPCSDGLIRISAMEDHQWRGVVAAMGAPEWTERFGSMQARIDGQDEVDERIAAWTVTIDKVGAETLLQANGVPATAVYSPAEILHSPQLDHRGAFQSVPLADGRAARVVGSPYRPVDAGAHARSDGAAPAVEPGRRSLRGLKVLEVSHVLAAPLAGALLGVLGAEVTKLEDLDRIDMYRRRGPHIDGVPGVDRSAYFAMVNHSKRSLALTVDGERDRLRQAIDDVDVVIENVGGRRAATLGVASSALAGSHPHVLGVSSSGFGQDGPFATYKAYAYNLQASCCLGYLTRSDDGEAAEIDLPWADVLSGYALATVVAAWAVGPTGNRGTGVDFAMADAVIARFNEFVAAASLDGDSDGTVDRANEVSPYAPNGVYPTEDGWVAVSVGDDDGFARLAQVLGDRLLGDPRFARASGRFEARRALDDAVARATSRRKADLLAAELRAVGVVAERLVEPTELPESGYLAERGFFAPVTHAEWGWRRLVGLPWRPYGGPALRLTAPPCLAPADRTGAAR